MSNNDKKNNIDWRHVSKNIKVTCTATQEITFDEWSIPPGTVFKGTYVGHNNDNDTYHAYFDVDEYKKRLGIHPWLFTVTLHNADYCFRCGGWCPSSEFQRHPLTHDISPILSQVCSDCYRKVKNKVSEHRGNANHYGGKNTLCASEWLEILLASQGKCHYCETEIGYSSLIMEHQVPLSWKGGHTKENVVPACTSCNSSKGDRDVETWQRNVEVKQLTALLQSRLHLSKLEVTNLAIRQLAIQEGLIEGEETEASA